MLVLIILGAIAVDFAIAFLGQRELSGLAAAAANDAATAALSDARFYRGTGTPADGGRIHIDEEAAGRVAQLAVERRRNSAVSNPVARVRTSGSQVCVTVRGEVNYVFAKAIPGAPNRVTVEGSAVAHAVEGDETRPAVPC